MNLGNFLKGITRVASVIPGPTSGALGALGSFLDMNDSNARARRQARSAQRRAQEYSRREVELFRDQMARVKESELNGALNTENQLSNVRASLARANRVSTGNQTAAFLRLGYKPGDSAPVEALRNQSERYGLALSQQEHDVRQSAEEKRLAAHERLMERSPYRGQSESETQRSFIARSQLRDPSGVAARLAEAIPADFNWFGLRGRKKN